MKRKPIDNRLELARKWLARAHKEESQQNTHVAISTEDLVAICLLAIDATKTPEWLSQALNEGDGVYRP